MNVKRAFDHLSRIQLLIQIAKSGIDEDLVQWTNFFLSNKKIMLVIDGHENNEREIKTGIPQGSRVSPILFLIYISGVLDEVTKNNH